jgi:signal transduction histidine kinase
LSPLVVRLPSLATRGAEIIEIALSIAERLAGDLGMPGARIGDDTLRDLAERQWPRNLDELSAAVGRALFSSLELENRELEASKVAGRPFARGLTLQRAASGAGPVVQPAASSAFLRSGGTASSSPPPRSTPEPMQAWEIERIVAELAHELKNPMVTIKTFGENLDTIFENPSLREKFTDLAREAIDRMDRFLEELMQFSRFSEPQKEPVALAQVLGGAIQSNAARVRDRVRMNGDTGTYRVRGDVDQLTFALRAVLRFLSRETAEEAPIHVDISPTEGLVFRSDLGDGARGNSDGDGNAEAEVSVPNSLDFILADALVRRHQGTTRILRRQSQLQVRVKLPTLERREDA